MVDGVACVLFVHASSSRTAWKSVPSAGLRRSRLAKSCAGVLAELLVEFACLHGSDEHLDVGMSLALSFSRMAVLPLSNSSALAP